MERINGYETGLRGLAKQVLSWITCVKRPLTTVELQHALAVEVGEEELDEENLPEIEDMVSVCAGLVTVDEESDIIRLVHYTTQEYFERAQKDWFPDAETDIANTCITYLSFNTFESGFCRTEKEFEARLRLNPLYDYAARNWGHHARAASTEMAILAFLESEAKVSSSSQALIASGSRYGYSQKVPKQMTGIHLAAYFGLGEAMVALLKNGHDPNSKDSGGRTPLSWAAANGHEAVVKLLLAKDGVDPDSKDGYGRTPLSWAEENQHEAIMRLLQEAKDRSEKTALHKAAQSGNEVVVQRLLGDGANVNVKGGSGETALHLAAGSGHEAVTQLLLQNRVDVDAKDSNGETALHYAAENGYKAVAKLLLENGADIAVKNKRGRTPLHWAARSGRKEVAKLLLEKGADVNAKGGLGGLALHWAAENGHEAVVQLLLKCGADVAAKNNYGKTALHWAAGSGHEAVVQLLLKNGSDVNANENSGTALYQAAKSGHMDVMRLLLEKGADISAEDESGLTALDQAIKNGHKAAEQLLLRWMDSLPLESTPSLLPSIL
jgi:ankyrin repeat protein